MLPWSVNRFIYLFFVLEYNTFNESIYDNNSKTEWTYLIKIFKSIEPTVRKHYK